MVSHWPTTRDVSTTQDGTGCFYLAQVTEPKEASKRSRRVPSDPRISKAFLFY
jgi:hypothetical protein